MDQACRLCWLSGTVGSHRHHWSFLVVVAAGTPFPRYIEHGVVTLAVTVDGTEGTEIMVTGVAEGTVVPFELG